ncbi:MAG: methyltransferase domain-containing protein [Candidatus Margulisbacteria bacterium]|nr:methyltransferase domain-containing protein [Candidatus Margulisiibacteriota bacterium]
MKEKYSFKNYVSLDRWVSYFHQINEVSKLNLENLLIIGKGDGIVGEILIKQRKKVKTLDMDSDLKPDIVASVEKMPLDENSFDIILCAEVLEHLPFEKFEQCLFELKRATKKYVVLSLPHFGPPVKLSFKIPLIKEIKLAFKIPFLIKHKFNKEHYWEIGKRGYSTLKIRKIIKRYFKIQREFVPFENQYHHFYILEK